MLVTKGKIVVAVLFTVWGCWSPARTRVASGRPMATRRLRALLNRSGHRTTKEIPNRPSAHLHGELFGASRRRLMDQRSARTRRIPHPWRLSRSTRWHNLISTATSLGDAS